MAELRMGELRISPNLSLPLTASTWVIAYLAKRGAGKTYNASVQAEEMLKSKIPIVVIDAMSVWWGLRVSSDGKGAGYPIVVFGGEHADLPLNPDKAEEMAKAIVETNISCVLDLSEFAKYTSRKVVTAFLNELYRLNRAERHVFIEEADMFAPQRPIGEDENLCLSAVDNFVRRGGNHNLGCTLITQRSAVLNKNILTQSDCLVIMRTLAPQDKEAIQAWVEEQTDKDKRALNEWYDSLKNLENGEAWVWHPEKPILYDKVKYRLRETFHATREFIKSPSATAIKLMDVSDFVVRFRNIFKEEPKPIGAITDPKMKEEIGHLQSDLSNTKRERDLVKDLNENLEAEKKQLQEELAKLAPIKKLRDALLEILPSAQIEPADGSRQTTMSINHTPLQVNIQDMGVKTVAFSTESMKGQMMYCIVNELPNTEEGWANSELIYKALEHGWAINKSTVSVELSKWAGQGLLIKTTKGYRLPKFVKFEIKGEK